MSFTTASRNPTVSSESRKS